MNNLSLSIPPEQRTLLEENAILREELAHLLTEEHDLIQILKPNLLALYQEKIGAWELRGLQAQLAELQARRRLELAQAALNQGRKPDLDEIDGQLELELLAWQQKLKEAAHALEAATTRLAQLLPEAENRELKKLYYALVKKLHPDVNPEAGEEARRIWLRVQAAYEHGDLQELKALTLLAKDADQLPETPKTLGTLRKDQEVLRAQIAAVLKRLEQWESQPPFTLRAQLADEAWLAERRQAIESRIVQLETQRAALEAQLKAIFPEKNDGIIFGLN